MQVADGLGSRLAHVDVHHASFLTAQPLHDRLQRDVFRILAVHAQDQVIGMRTRTLRRAVAKWIEDLDVFFLLVERDLNAGPDIAIGSDLAVDAHCRRRDHLRLAGDHAEQAVDERRFPVGSGKLLMLVRQRRALLQHRLELVDRLDVGEAPAQILGRRGPRLFQ